jgi:hypothetical protein
MVLGQGTQQSWQIKNHWKIPLEGQDLSSKEIQSMFLSSWYYDSVCWKGYKQSLSSEMKKKLIMLLILKTGIKKKNSSWFIHNRHERFIQRILQVEDNEVYHKLYYYFTDMSLNLWNNNVIKAILDANFSKILLVTNSLTAHG